MSLVYQVLSEKDIAVLVAIRGECSEGFPTPDAGGLIDGRRAAPITGFGAQERNGTDPKVFPGIFIIGSASADNNIRSESIHRYWLGEPSVEVIKGRLRKEENRKCIGKGYVIGL